MDRKTELDNFKTHINLTEYAAYLGYVIDRDESWRNGCVMRNGDEKIVIGVDAKDNHWVYWSARDASNTGSIIDLHQRHTGDGLGKTRIALRNYQNIPSPSRPSAVTFQKSVAPASKDRQKVLQAYAKTVSADQYPYLNERGIDNDVLTSKRFRGRVRIDDRNNAIFPHFSEGGICGFEIKNRSFTGFSAGGDKSLWLSHRFKDDTTLVFCESAIDCISYHVIHGDDKTQYASTAGSWGTQIETVICKLVDAFSGQEVVLAFDSDPDGEKHTEKAMSLLADCGKTINRHRPSLKDFNDDLVNTPMRNQ